MAMELDGAIDRTRTNNETRDTMYLLGGAALILFGAGLILSTPMVKRALGGTGIGNLLGGAVPDLERYLRLKAM